MRRKRELKRKRGTLHSKKRSCRLGPLTPKMRLRKSFKIQKDNAFAYYCHRNLSDVDHRCNGDEALYKHKIGNFSKALPHNHLGEVDRNAYHSLIKALHSGDPNDFESISMGGVQKLANPQAAYAFDLFGSDSHLLEMDAPPKFSSAWEASEMAEVYWRALTRDVPFAEFHTHKMIQEAAADLSRFSDFRGPKEDGRVTTHTLFRGNITGALEGPFISQFLWQDIPYGIQQINQRYYTPLVGDEFMTTYEEWLDIQNGNAPSASNQLDTILRYIRNGRDLGEWVHKDFPFQAYLNTCLILLQYGKGALDLSNPYLHSKTQDPFITFGSSHILDFVAKAVRKALEAAWFQKWLVHRRLRPEEFGGRVHHHLTRAASYPIHDELLKSKALIEVHKKYGTYLLPQAYPEGSPTHPSYPAGHSCVAGAAVTVLKAFFNESFSIPTPVEACSDGTSLLPYKGHSLTIGGELNKLATNIAHGRDTAGVHWRSDGIEGLKLGEEVAIEMFRDYKETYNEKLNGFSLTKFDGTKITI